MDMRFQAIIEAAVEQAKAEQSLLWADEVAERIASSTPLTVRAADISEQISDASRRAAGVAVTVQQSGGLPASERCGASAA